MRRPVVREARAFVLLVLIYVAMGFAFAAVWDQHERIDAGELAREGVFHR